MLYASMQRVVLFREWLECPALSSLALNDKALVSWPADSKGQQRIPTALGLKLNAVPRLPC